MIARQIIFPAVAAWFLTHAAYAAQCAVPDALDTYPSREAPPVDATCTTYLTEGSDTGVSCFWTFPYRSAEATAFAEMLWQAVTECRSGEPVGPDQRVNHPDSYALQAWPSPKNIYAVSVKDKAALGTTLVFVRAEPR